MHDLSPKVEPPIAVGKYLEMILREGLAEVTFRVGEYIISQVESVEMWHKIDLLKELEFINVSDNVVMSDEPHHRYPINPPIAAGDYLETILGWGIAEVTFTDGQYVITRVDNDDTQRKIAMLVELELVEAVAEFAHSH